MSAETKWTPGEWAVHPRASTYVYVPQEKSGMGRGIATTGGYTSNVDGERVLVENEANAALIAAAPRLYAALEKAAEEAEALVMNDALIGSTMADYFSDKAAEWRRLLAAARGEAAP